MALTDRQRHDAYEALAGAFADQTDLVIQLLRPDHDQLATKSDLERFATKTDLERFATKTDLERFATRSDLEVFATKTDLERFATKTDLERFATRHDLDELAARIDARFETVDARTEAMLADAVNRLTFRMLPAMATMIAIFGAVATLF